MADVVFESVTRIYPGSRDRAVDGLDLHIADGEFMVLVGPSGCGKTTTLRMLAGLEGVDDGAIYIGGSDVTRLPPKDRDIAMVFQEYALYPHMTVEQNIGFHLKIAKRPKREVAERVGAVSRLLGLEELLDRKPAKLSGGQRQRVAMGRAIVREPQVFLLDEPLSNLDAKLRVQTRGQIASLQRRLGVTTLYVTHDQVEAMTMGDRVAVLDGGRLQQCDTPREMFARPANTFVAGFIGSPAMNLLVADVHADGVELGNLRLGLTPAQRAALTGPQVVIGVRPNDFLAAADSGGLAVTVEMVEELGMDAYAYCARDGAAVDEEQIAVRFEPKNAPDRAARLTLVPRPGSAHLFDAHSGGRLPD
jgi:multiple sugar transport system ATP-binding protein